MADPNLRDFYGRVTRIEKARAKGSGLEAEGTLGRSHYHRPYRSRRSVLKPIIFVLICAVGLKATIHFKVGAQSYDSRVAGLAAGEGIDRLGAFLMQADPVTLFVSGQIRHGVAMLVR